MNTSVNGPIVTETIDSCRGIPLNIESENKYHNKQGDKIIQVIGVNVIWKILGISHLKMAMIRAFSKTQNFNI